LHQLAEDFMATYGYETAPTQNTVAESHVLRGSECSRAVR
jgi:hypothetical protein